MAGEVTMNDRRQKSAASSGERKVGMGELEVLQGAGVLRTLLGSCIGLVLHDQRKKIGGLAHIVLPEGSESSSLPGKYANTAVPELIRRIEQSGGRLRDLAAKFAGGSNMFATGNANAIGDLNIAKVDSLLAALGIPVLARHCGGKQGRRMAFDVETGKVTVEIVGGPPVEL
jgi:chemotaxis protein CheD